MLTKENKVPKLVMPRGGMARALKVMRQTGSGGVIRFCLDEWRNGFNFQKFPKVHNQMHIRDGAVNIFANAEGYQVDDPQVLMVNK